MANAQHVSHPAVTLSVRIQPETRDQLELLANATGRTKSFLAAEAIEHYLSIQVWQINAIDVKFTEHENVVDWLTSWGTKKEQEPPK